MMKLYPPWIGLWNYGICIHEFVSSVLVVSLVLNLYRDLSYSFKEVKINQEILLQDSIMKWRTDDSGQTSQLHKMKPRCQLKAQPGQHEDLLLWIVPSSLHPCFKQKFEFKSDLVWLYAMYWVLPKTHQGIKQCTHHMQSKHVT